MERSDRDDGSGPISGDTAGGVLVFEGISYPAPPIGPRRWRPRQPPTPWTAPLDATRFGASCPQPQRQDRGGDVGPTDESCLFLNVWTKAQDGKRPVMMWIHGGAFRLGSGSMAIYDGTRFAQSGVVLVTLNYRLGRFGFFSAPNAKHRRAVVPNPSRRARRRHARARAPVLCTDAVRYLDNLLAQPN